MSSYVVPGRSSSSEKTIAESDPGAGNGATPANTSPAGNAGAKGKKKRPPKRPLKKTAPTPASRSTDSVGSKDGKVAGTDGLVPMEKISSRPVCELGSTCQSGDPEHWVNYQHTAPVNSPSVTSPNVGASAPGKPLPGMVGGRGGFVLPPPGSGKPLVPVSAGTPTGPVAGATGKPLVAARTPTGPAAGATGNPVNPKGRGNGEFGPGGTGKPLPKPLPQPPSGDSSTGAPPSRPPPRQPPPPVRGTSGSGPAIGNPPPRPPRNGKSTAT